ncbi:uncharacterized protein BYT42DRAFT_589320, partial [Radiomyces spectabilis]|uniref:uncharacterized protein n=1 Tax=Radiomyces spectabilis TaxID=64574 RepID=UPI00221F7DBC
MNRMKQRHREECRRSLLMTSDHPLAKTNRYSQSVAALHYTENTSPSRVTLIDLPPQAPYMARSTSLMTDLYQKSQLPAHAKRQSLQLTDADFHPSRLLQNQPLLA